MVKANTDVRAALKSAKVPIWACAAEMGIHENTLLRKLRFELSEDEKKLILSIADKIRAQKNTAQ